MSADLRRVSRHDMTRRSCRNQVEHWAKPGTSPSRGAAFYPPSRRSRAWRGQNVPFRRATSTRSTNVRQNVDLFSPTTWKPSRWLFPGNGNCGTSMLDLLNIFGTAQQTATCPRRHPWRICGVHRQPALNDGGGGLS